MGKMLYKKISKLERITGLKRYRNFDGKRYELYAHGHTSKKNAEQHADSLRKKKNYLARVIKTKLYKWCIYAHINR